MADASKLKFLKKTLGQAPTLEEASNNIYSPEVAPASDYINHSTRIDGRSMRRTNRTVRLATSVTPEFDYTLRKIALENNMLLSEVLEEALKLYQSSKN
jgi:hypothetical protein